MKFEIEKLAKIFLVAVIIISFGAALWMIKTPNGLVEKSAPFIAIVPASTPEPTMTPGITPEIEITPMPTPNLNITTWKIYKNDQYGFEIKYNPTWQIDLMQSSIYSFIADETRNKLIKLYGFNKDFDKDNFKVKQSPYGKEYFISITNKDISVSIDSFLEKNPDENMNIFGYPAGPPLMYENRFVKKIKKGDAEWLMTESYGYTMDGDYYSISYETSKDKNLYSISYGSNECGVLPEELQDKSKIEYDRFPVVINDKKGFEDFLGKCSYFSKESLQELDLFISNFKFTEKNNKTEVDILGYDIYIENKGVGNILTTNDLLTSGVSDIFPKPDKNLLNISGAVPNYLCKKTQYFDRVILSPDQKNILFHVDGFGDFQDCNGYDWYGVYNIKTKKSVGLTGTAQFGWLNNGKYFFQRSYDTLDLYVQEEITTEMKPLKSYATTCFSNNTPQGKAQKDGSDPNSLRGYYQRRNDPYVSNVIGFYLSELLKYEQVSCDNKDYLESRIAKIKNVRPVQVEIVNFIPSERNNKIIIISAVKNNSNEAMEYKWELNIINNEIKLINQNL